MKNFFLSFIKSYLFLFIGLFLVYYSYSNTTIEERNQILDALKFANYKFVFLALLFALLSHLIRAFRWNYILNPLGYKIKFLNSFMSLMISYLYNLGVPRSGELLRASSIMVYEKVPFKKAFGSIIVERSIDVFLLIVCLILSIYFYPLMNIQKLEVDSNNILIFLLFLSILLPIIYYVIKKYKLKSKIIILYKDLIKGIYLVLNMPNKKLFIYYSFIIWLMYYLILYSLKFSFDETNLLTFESIFIVFVASAISMSVSNGGIGVYPLAISTILLQYGISYEISLAFGWIAWTSQTIMNIIFGSLSLFFLPLYNKK